MRVVFVWKRSHIFVENRKRKGLKTYTPHVVEGGKKAVAFLTRLDEEFERFLKV